MYTDTQGQGIAALQDLRVCPVEDGSFLVHVMLRATEREYCWYSHTAKDAEAVGRLIADYVMDPEAVLDTAFKYTRAAAPIRPKPKAIAPSLEDLGLL